MSCRKTKKSLPRWDTSANPPLTVRLPSQVPRPYSLAVCLLICPWRNGSLTRRSLFWQVIKLLKTLLLRSSSSELSEKLYLLDYSLQFVSNKTLSHFYYRLFIDSSHQHTERFVSLPFTFLHSLLHVLLYNNHPAADFIFLPLNSASKIFIKADIIMNFW